MYMYILFTEGLYINENMSIHEAQWFTINDERLARIMM